MNFPLNLLYDTLRHGGKVGPSPETPGPPGPLGLPGSLGPSRTSGTPDGCPEPSKTPSNPRDLLEPIRIPGISLGPRKDFAKRPVLLLIKAGDITKEF